jgi:predicted metalloprotease
LLKLYQEGLSALSPRPYLHNHVIDLKGNGRTNGRCYMELRSGRHFNWIGGVIFEDEYIKVGDQWEVADSYRHRRNQRYVRPTLKLFSGRVSTACGAASEAMGPFYCPGDQLVYLDLSFFHEMETRFHAAGDFARAYVIAHEVGHHVQNLLGIMRQVSAQQQRGASMEGANGLSLRLELQADCFAGVWGNRSQAQLDWINQTDVNAALNAASAVGDDTLQKQARGYAVPDSFTHGSAAQRQRWFNTGFRSGDIKSCDTFGPQTR